MFTTIYNFIFKKNELTKMKLSRLILNKKALDSKTEKTLRCDILRELYKVFKWI